MNNIYEEILSAVNGNKKAALCTVISSKGSTPRKVGAKMIVYEDSRIYGTIGGGDLEKKVIENAKNIIRTGKYSVFKHDLLNQHGMCCGGFVEIFIEPIMNKKRLFIFGAGHTGQALAQIASLLEFEIFLIDDRKEYLDSCELHGVNKMYLEHSKALQALSFDDNTFIVITTYSHQIDRDILAFCLKKPFAYLGMIGSKRKINVTKDMFLNGDIGTPDDIQKVHMPIGMDISAETPQEIAVSILAEIIQIKNKIVHEK
jgi:xanthine dehydrogenase accessory factor